jgi:hypothetical protein
MVQLGNNGVSLAAVLGVALLSCGCSSEAPKHWSSLQQCLIGGELKKDENVFNRLRGVQLAESLSATGSPQDWPTRCEGYATELYEALSDGGKPGMIRRALGEQMGCDGACVFPKAGHVLPAADKLWEAVSRAELSTVDVADVPKPGAPASSLTRTAWPSLGSGNVLSRRWSESGQLWLLTGSERKLSWCSFSGAKASCAPGFHIEFKALCHP